MTEPTRVREVGPGVGWVWPTWWALVGAFALHNVEEIVTARGGGLLDPGVAARLGIDPALFRADRFALATALLTVAVAAAVLPWRRRGPGPARVGPVRAAVVVAVAGALGLNAVVHLGRGLVTGSANPGIWSAPALLAVAGVVAVGVVRASGLRRGSAVVAALSGAVLMAPAIVLALGAARAFLP